VDTAVTTEPEYTIPSGIPLDYSVGTYYATIMAQQGESAVSAEATFVFELYNTLPSPPEIVISPGKPRTLDTLEVTILNGSVDADGDPVTYTYRWYKKGIEISNQTGTQIPSAVTAKNEEWKVRVIPNDGIEDGISANLSVTIRNTRPSVGIQVPVGGQEFKEGDQINFLGNASDVDGDNLTYMWDSDQVGQLMNNWESLTSEGLTIDFGRTLKAGEHKINLTVRDGDETTSVGLNVTVKAKSGRGPEPDITDTINPLYLGIIIAAIIGAVVVFVVMMVLARRRAAEDEIGDLVDGPGSASALYGNEFSEAALDARLAAGPESPPPALEGGPPPALPPAGGSPGGPPPGAPPS